VRTDGIPKSFQLMGHTIKVRVIQPSKWRHGAKNVGHWNPNKYLIDVLAVQPESHRQQIFCHELMHALFDMAGHEALSQDEVLVDRMGHLIQQALTTFEA
jgi:hypothetical protein